MSGDGGEKDTPTRVARILRYIAGKMHAVEIADDDLRSDVDGWAAGLLGAADMLSTDCRCPTPTLTGRGTCETCGGFACDYADHGTTRCPSWRCDCFIDTHPHDNPQGLHPEAFIVGRVIPSGGSDA